MTSDVMFTKLSRRFPAEAQPLLPEQVERFTLQSLQAKPVRAFDARRSLSALRGQHGKTVIAVDMGGDKISASLFTVNDDGILCLSGQVLTRRGDDGSGYLEALHEVRDLARARSVPVGISFAGPTNGTRILAAPNLSLFLREFQDRYDGDFACLFPVVELANDAESGIMAGAMEAARRSPGADDVIYVINGSGLGGAALVNGMIYAAEPGHIPVIDQLNSFGEFSQVKPCGLGGATHVCVESVGASKAGVEDIWCQMTGERLSGREIAARYASGDGLASSLYRNSAVITAHAVAGMAAAFDLLEDARRLVVVAHGGIFQIAGYGEEVRATLGRSLRMTPTMLFTKDFSGNTCLEGAAIAVASSRA